MRIILIIALLSGSSIVFGQAKTYTVVFLYPNKEVQHTKEEVSKIMEGHMANIRRLGEEGKMLMAGPFEIGGGIFIMNSSSVDSVRSWLRGDPGIEAKRWNIEMLPLTLRYGSICKAEQPIKMLPFSFVRFDAVVSKSTASTFPQIIQKHNSYLKQLINTGNVICEGIFGEYDGGIMLMSGDVGRSVFESDPGVQEALIDISIKTIYVAKGSFCDH